MQSVVPVAQAALLEWYRKHGRDLPWRHTSDPYHILVAEVMLQQTQVERVLPKYREFLEAFPTVADLAAAPRGEVIRRWAPLGYNLRAVRLHEVARQVVDRWDGRFPSAESDLLTLKGIGPYTAGAILCFAFRKPAVFLDTNLRRVLGRCFGGLPYPRPGGDKEVLRVARAVLPAEATYEWHQALMDLGATVCLWSRPRCDVCPMAAWCRARDTLARPATASADSGAGRMPALPGPLTRPATASADSGAGGMPALPGTLTTPATAIAEPVAPYRAQPKFSGSRRYYRGRTVSLLRELGPGEAADPEVLGRRLKPDWSDEDRGWLMELLAGLERDGLVKLTAKGVALP